MNKAIDATSRTDHVTWWRHKMETFSALLAFVRGIHRSPMNSPHKSQWRGALMFALICAWINAWANYREAGDLIRHRVHYDAIVMGLILIIYVLADIQAVNGGRWSAETVRTISSSKIFVYALVINNF